VGIISKELLSLEIEFGKLVPKGSIHENQIFILKKIIHETIFSNVIDFFLHRMTHAKSAKETWDNFYATFEK